MLGNVIGPGMSFHYREFTVKRLVGKKKKNRNPFERWTFKLFKKNASIDDTTNDTPRRELIWNEGTNQRATQIYTTLPSPRSHRFVTVRDWPLPCAPTPHWSREPAALPIFSHSTLLLISLSSTEDAFFSRDEPTASAYPCKHTEIICRYSLAQIRPNWPSVNFHPLMNFNFAKGISYFIFSLYVSK